MLQQDYLMRIVSQLTEAIRRSWSRVKEEESPKQAADMLEAAIGNAIDMDSSAMLMLASDSFAGILRATGTDPRVTEYVARTLMLEAEYLKEAHEEELADVRIEQARALAREFDFVLPDQLEVVTPEDVTTHLTLS